MRYLVLIILALLIHPVQAEEPPSQLPSRPNIEAGSPPSTIVNNVNIILGDYAFTSHDLTLPCSGGFSIGRTYCNLSNYENWLGYEWNWSCKKTLGGQICLAEGNSSTYLKKIRADEHKTDKSHYIFDPYYQGQGVTNMTAGYPSGRTNIKNIKAFSNFILGEHIVYLPSGERQYYNKQIKYSMPVRKVRLTNGNWLHYTYHPETSQIAQITVKDSLEEATLSWVKFDLVPVGKNRNPHIHLTSSSGRTSIIEIEGANKHGKRVRSVEFFHGPKESYSYAPRRGYSTPPLAKRKLPLGGGVEIEYYQGGSNQVAGKTVNLNSEKNLIDYVKCIRAPIGENGEYEPITSYIYHVTPGYKYGAGSTEVYDAYNRRTDYFYDYDLRITDIKAYYPNGTLAKNTCYAWGASKSHETSNLKFHWVENERQQPQYITEFIYDTVNNPTTVHFYGHITGELQTALKIQNGQVKGIADRQTKTYTYSNGFHLVLSETDCNGNKTYYEYKPDTDLLTAKFICEGEEIRIRNFFEYNSAAILIKSILDDGTTRDPLNLTGVTERKIIETIPHMDIPLCGLVHTIQESVLNTQTGQQEVVQTIRKEYDEHRKLIKESLYATDGSLLSSNSAQYDERGLKIEETDSLGRTTYYAYDADQQLVCQKCPSKGIETSFTYNLLHRLIKQETRFSDGSSQVQSFSYDKVGNKISETDPLGNSTIYEYDYFDRLVKVVYPSTLKPNGLYESDSVAFTYDIHGNRTSVTNTSGAVTSTEWNSLKSPLKITHPDGTYEIFRYNIDGALKWHQSPTGAINLFQYDYQNRLLKKTLCYPDGTEYATHTYLYSTFHLISETDPEGVQTHYQYDAQGRLISSCRINQENVSLTRFEYDAQGRQTKTISYYQAPDEKASVACKVYDAIGRIVSERVEELDGTLLSKIVYEYDLNDNKIACHRSIDEERVSSVFYLYDARNRLIRQTDPDGYATSIQYNEIENSQGQYVQQTATIDPLNRLSIATYDARGRIQTIEIRNAQNMVTAYKEFALDGEGNKCLEIDYRVLNDGLFEDAIVTLWKYDSMGRLQSVSEAWQTPEEKTTRYTYNALGQKEAIIKADGKALIHAYDAFGRLQNLSSTDRSVSYSYEYDRNNRVVRVDNDLQNQATMRSYDAFGNLISETLESGLKLQYQYDPIGRCRTITLPDQSAVEYRHNALHIQEINRINPQGKILYTHQYAQYDLLGNPLQEILAKNAGTLQLAYTPSSRTREIGSPHWRQTVPEDGYDPVGNLLCSHIEDPIGEYTQRYTYDDLNQLTNEKGNEDHDYTYDSLGNRRSHNGQACEVNLLHQLLEDANGLYNYDWNGNMCRHQSEEGVVEYDYDALDRLIEVRLPTGISHRYTYDAFHRRLSKETLCWQSEGWISKKKQYFIYAGDNEIGSTEDNWQIKELRILGLGKGAEIGGSVAIEIFGHLFIPIHNLSGNIVQLINGRDGLFYETIRYTAFGEEKIWTRDLEEIDITDSFNPWRFSSKRFDPETRFFYFGRRYYSPAMGRWITQDPKGFIDGPNLYAYVLNNPLSKCDPYGLSSKDKDELEEIRYDEKNERDQEKSFLDKALDRYAKQHVLESEIFQAQARNGQRIMNAVADKASRVINFSSIQPEVITVCDRGNQNKMLFLVNGINTRGSEARENASKTAAVFSDYTVKCIYNPTGGVLRDCPEAYFQKQCKYYSKTSALLKSEIESHLTNYPHANLVVMGNSQGGVICRETLRKVSAEIAGKLNVAVFGSPGMIKDERLKFYRNYVAERDYVVLSDFGRYCTALNRNDPRVVLIPTRKGSSFLENHSFTGEAYSSGVKNFYNQLVSKIED